MASKMFKVIIAGGSSSGLALASMLEKAGIDFVVLEKYGEIAPNVGAGIAMQANGARLLDQLGCYDEYLRLAQDGAFENSQWHQDGKIIWQVRNFNSHIQKRFGFPMVMINRRNLIKLLYDSIKDKSKVLVNKGVSKVEQVQGGIRVTTDDGDIFTGDMLVGADGVHSFVRKEMWRIGDAERPGYFPAKDRTAARSNYRALFGIADDTPGIDMDNFYFYHGKDYCPMVGPSDKQRFSWCVSYKLPETLYGLYDKIPRFTDVERDTFAESRFEDRINESGVKFRSLWDKSTDRRMTVLTEYIMSKWHYGRIMTIGDAAAKYNPIIGQGGNHGIEGAAALTNSLYHLLDGKPAGFKPSDEQLDAAFEQAQRRVSTRFSITMKIASFLQSMYARESAKFRLTRWIMLKSFTKEASMGRLGASYKAGVRLDMLDVPSRPHVEPWFDERKSKVLIYQPPIMVIAAVFIALVVAALQIGSVPPTWLRWEGLFKGSFEVLTRVPVSVVDQTYAAYSLVFSLPLYIVLSIESRRYITKSLLLSWPFIFIALGNATGLSVGAALYYLIHIYTFAGSDEFSQIGVAEAAAKAIQPLTRTVYALAAIFLFMPNAQNTPFQSLATIWPLALLLVDLITALRFQSQRSNDRKADPTLKHDFDEYSRAYYPHITTAYRFATIFGTVIYLTAVAASVYQLQNKGSAATALVKLGSTFAVDMGFMAAATLVFMSYNAYELRRRGLITSRQTWSAVVLSVLGVLVMGPGALVAMLWWWKERLVVEASEKVQSGRPVVLENRKAGK